LAPQPSLGLGLLHKTTIIISIYKTNMCKMKEETFLQWFTQEVYEVVPKLHSTGHNKGLQWCIPWKQWPWPSTEELTQNGELHGAKVTRPEKTALKHVILLRWHNSTNTECVCASEMVPKQKKKKMLYNLKICEMGPVSPTAYGHP
jgi:hypothetical protein